MTDSVADNAIPMSEDLPAFVRITLRVWLKIYASLIRFVRPFFDLFVRLTIAFGLFRSGIIKAFDWDTALTLANQEYPVSFMAPATAALIGVIIELAGAVLLALGLFTRSAALAVALLLGVSQAVYIPTDINLFIIAFMICYMVRGAGAFSLDHLLGRGLEGSALPLADTIATVSEKQRNISAPLLLLLLRLWLAVTLLIAADVLPGLADARFFPSGSFAPLPAMLSISLAIFAVLGLAMPLVGIALLASLTGAQFMAFNPALTTAAMLFVLIFLFYGAGYISVDRLVQEWFQRHVLFDRRIDKVPAHWPHVVVVGGGFGGIACVAQLKRLPVRITLIDRNNYHLFQPLLYQIATASLSPADVATPIRSLYREDGNVRVLLGEVSAVDREARTVTCDGEDIAFDWLVLATGASHSYFGKDQWAPYAPGLKRIEDAVAVRAHVLRAFEKAEASNDPAEIERLLTFVIVGAGPTGVELSGAIAELARHGLKNEYRNFDPAIAKVKLVQSGPRVLPAFPEDLSEKAEQSLRNLGVEVLLGNRVTDIQADHVKVGDMRIDTQTVLWAAGVVASPAAKWLDCEADRSGRVVVDDHLRAADSDHIFAIGDTAASTAWAGDPVPGLAPAAKQAGKYVSRMIRADLTGSPEPQPFVYKHQGSLATIGRKSAIADFGWTKLSGATAWWLWGVVHVGFLVGVRNRLSVIVNWVWNYFTLQLGIRLITGTTPEAPESSKQPAE
ncbi:MAG: FAD-dependent oxidoreductase [Pseudomonadota bacterium]